MVLAIGLLGVSYQLSLPGIPSTATPVVSPSSGETPSALQITTTAAPANDTTSESSPSAFFQDASLVLATGLIAFSGYFIAGYIQSVEKSQVEIREKRKQRTKVYRDYLQWLLSVGEHSMLISENSVLKEVLPKKGAKFFINGALLEKAVETLPLAWELSELRDDNDTKEALDAAISQGIRFITDLYSGQQPDYNAISSTYQAAIEALDRYEKYG